MKRVSIGYGHGVQDQRDSTPEPRPDPVTRTEATFARRLRDLREKQGVSQARLAEKVSGFGFKIDDLAILRMEKNADSPGSGRRIRLGEAALIAKALEHRLGDMLRDPADPEDQLADAERELEAARAELRSYQAQIDRAADRFQQAEDRVKYLRQLRDEDISTAPATAPDRSNWVTKQQQQIIDFVYDWVKSRGLPPLLEVISNHFEIDKKDAASEVDLLQKKGLLPVQRAQSLDQLVPRITRAAWDEAAAEILAEYDPDSQDVRINVMGEPVTYKIHAENESVAQKLIDGATKTFRDEQDRRAMMRLGLSGNESSILSYFASYIEQHGKTPSVAAASRATRFSRWQVDSALRHLHELNEQDALTGQELASILQAGADASKKVIEVAAQRADRRGKN
ncbi:hypothetical protein [Haloechinothrix salitolerans]|uniref:Multiprotein-bridging factor 1 family protein n=1 Tax=Haloechinothrix salitolerans TaxID=926830 RepID=A0ABW2BXH1_9PSEU